MSALVVPAMGPRARTCTWIGLACVALLVACTAPPTDITVRSDGKVDAPASPGSTAQREAPPAPLRPLARQQAAPADAPQSRVASVRYDLDIGGAGDLPPDDGLPGDAAPAGEVFERGGASYYGLQFHQHKTASGERFDMGAMTAAHKTLPFGTRVCVRSLVNGREVLVRINDRGPYVAGRIIDLSQAAAESLQMIGLGIKQVTLTRIGSEGGRCNGSTIAAADDAAIAPFGTAAHPAARPNGAKRKVARRRK